MHAANPTGGKDFEVGMLTGEHRPGNGRAAADLLGDHGCKVPGPDLMRVLAFASRSISLSLSPTCRLPSRNAMVAGVAPSARTACSISCASCRFWGRGKPWVSTVDSRATMDNEIPIARFISLDLIICSSNPAI